jgi:hypothetical protein
MDNRTVKWSIPFKLLGGMLALEVLVSALLAVLLVTGYRRQLADEALRAVKRAQGAHELLLRGDVQTLSAALDGFLASQSQALQLFAEHADRQRLQAAIQELFRNNRSRYRITHFYFIDKDGTCWLRVHKPEQFGDPVRRETLLRARANGTTASGLELGKTAFALRVVTPWVRDGALQGFVEMGEEIDHLDALLQHETGFEVATLVEKRFLDEADYRGGRKSAARRDDWDDLEGYAMASTTAADPRSIAASFPIDRLATIGSPEYLGTVEHGQQILARGAFPLRDVAGRQVGVVVVLGDVTDQVASQRLTLLAMALAGAVIFVLTFVVAAWFLRVQILAPISDLARAADEIRDRKSVV